MAMETFAKRVTRVERELTQPIELPDLKARIEAVFKNALERQGLNPSINIYGTLVSTVETARKIEEKYKARTPRYTLTL